MPSKQQQIILYILLFLSLLICGFTSSYKSDVTYWITWSEHMFINGISSTYDVPKSTYNPFYQYVLFTYGKLMGSTENIRTYIHSLKAFTLLFDFAGAILAASLTDYKKQRFTLSLFLLLNIGYVYNTILWQQIDSIYTFFAFAAVIAAVNGYAASSIALFILAINTKAQAIIFTPALLLLWLVMWVKKPITLVKSVIIACGLQFALLAPFIWSGPKNQLPKILEINFNNVDLIPVVSKNALNLWCILLHQPDLESAPDTILYHGISYRNWGLMLFFTFSFITLLPLAIISFNKILYSKHYNSTLAFSLLTCGALPIMFAYFNTQMHERYWHPAVLFFAGYAFITNRYHIFILTSIAYFLNLEDILHALKIPNFNFIIFQPRLIALMFTGVLGLSLFEIYRNFTNINKQSNASLLHLH